MKIKTITCHDVYNYGASLQAYALQKYLITLGHESEIIDYKPDYLRNHYRFWYVPKNSRYYNKTKHSKLFKFILCCYFAPKRFATYPRKIKFDAFKKKYLCLSKRYDSYNELLRSQPEADVYLAGSDQIWNTTLPNGKDPSFFLQFGNKHTKRISYAASFAIPKIDDNDKVQIQQWLKIFDAISVRERTGIDILNTLGLEGIEVLDPVFLISEREWMRFAGKKRIIKYNYLLIYDLYLNDNRLHTEAIRLAKKMKLKVVAVDGVMKCPYADKNVSNAGPNEFVNLIQNAKFVITNSFHATSFSIIFKKPFKVFYKYENISRMSDLLNKLGLAECLNSENSDFTYNWSQVELIMQPMINTSKSFLIDNLN